MLTPKERQSMRIDLCRIAISMDKDILLGDRERASEYFWLMNKLDFDDYDNVRKLLDKYPEHRTKC